MHATLRLVKFTRPSVPVIVTVALLVMVSMLAALQYRWVGQVSEADRERMQNHVRNAALQFREALDGEIARAVLNLQVGTATARDGSSDRYTDRYDAWTATASHPQLVANVFLLNSDDEGRLQLRRWSAVRDLFEPAEWPDTLRPWQTQFQQDLDTFTQGRFNQRRFGAFGDIDESIVVAPLRLQGGGNGGGGNGGGNDGGRNGNNDGRRGDGPDPVFGYTIVQLDLDYVRTQMLPELAQRYFMTLDKDGYRVAVTSAMKNGAVIFRSDAEAPTDQARADAVEPLFGMRGDAFFRFGGRGGGNGGRQVINIFRGPGGRDGVNGGPGFGRWTLIAQHRSGSLDAAVAQARNRNLGIGFGILLMLSGSVSMLALTSRRAQRLAGQQMEFVAGVSHELRTPIAVIRSAAENLASGVVGNPDRVKRYGDAIGTEARRLGEMVEQVILHSGLESGRGIGAATPLVTADLIEQAIAEAAAVIKAAGVNVDRRIDDALPPVVGDAIALRSAVQNLIANAVKYGGEDRWVGVRVERAGTARTPSVKITIEDHGAGIPASDLPHIFEPFFRGAEAIGRQIHGNGLGLSIVKRIVTAHGGKIDVATRAGEGTAFTLTLPAVDPATVTGPLTSAEAHS